MNILLTRHAKNRNRAIKATLYEIAECISEPDSHYVQEDGKEVAIKAVGDKFLKVVYRKTGDAYAIITIIDRNL